jgi:RNA polymerase sigma factor (sigma-70 family)
MMSSTPDWEAAAPLRSTTTTQIPDGTVAAVVAYLRDPESLRKADAAAAALYPIAVQQTRRQCRCSDRLYLDDLDEIKQATLIRLFNRGYLRGNRLLREAVDLGDDGSRIAGFIRYAVAAAVRISLRELLREPFVQSRTKAIGAENGEADLDDIPDETATHDERVELRKLSLELIPSATDEEKEIVQLRAEGMTYSEIGGALELNPERVKTVIRSLRKRLRRYRTPRRVTIAPKGLRPVGKREDRAPQPSQP